MDVDPKTTSDSSLAGEPTREGGQLPPTEKITDSLLKGRYLLGPELGRGGFAITYLAADVEVASRKVVVKILNEYRSTDAWSLKKFRSEMEALARIDHPNVVSVFDFGYLADGKPFLVMQYIPGRRLREMIPRNGLPLGLAAEILKQTGRALTAAHEVGVCHRDLKPENIMVQSDDDGEEQIKLIDFGIASIHAAGEESSCTTSSGTHAYMAPEQFQGKVSFASDVYQMGIVAYELVTGITPFRAPTSAGILLQQMDGLKILPKDLRADLPDAAQEAILKALSPDPRDRYQRAREFGDALATALVSDQPESAEWMKRRSGSSSTARLRLPARTPRTSRWMLPVVVILAAIALSAAVYFVLRSRTPAVDSVAVLPFQNRTGDPQMAYLADGITESLINDLSRIPTLRVSARGSIVKYGSSTVDARAAGRDLGVTRIVDGFISRQGDDFSLDTELIDVRSGARLWGNEYTGKISSLTEVLQQFSTEVTDQLRLKLSGSLKDRLKRQYATRSESYQEYLKARFYLNKRTTAGFEEAVRYFDEAIKADPDYAPAYAGLAYSEQVMAFNGSADPVYALEKSRRAANQALQLDSTLAEAYNARAFVEMQADYKWEAAEADFLRSISLNPNWSDTHEAYALELAALGRFDEAIREIETAETLEPKFFPFGVAHALVLYLARQNDESLSLLRTLGKNPFELSIVAPAMAQNYWVKSMPRDALAAAQETPAVLPDRVLLLIISYARMGQAEKAQQLLAGYVMQGDATSWYYLALANLSLGQTNEALRDLENACDQHAQQALFLGVDAMLDGLRADPRFRALLARINLNRRVER